MVIVLSLAAIPLGALVSALRDPMLHRRPRFWLRFAGVVICMLIPWTVALIESVGAQIALGMLLLGLAWALVLLTVAPALLFRHEGSDPGPSDDGGGGPGGGGDRKPPDRPLGGIPLPDADQPRWRLRGPHRRPHSLRPRRPARERERRPTRV